MVTINVFEVEQIYDAALHEGFGTCVSGFACSFLFSSEVDQRFFAMLCKIEKLINDLEIEAISKQTDEEFEKRLTRLHMARVRMMKRLNHVKDWDIQDH